MAAVPLSPSVSPCGAVSPHMPLGTVLPCRSEDAHALFENIEGRILVPVQFQPAL
jgi:hypothetical protein